MSDPPPSPPPTPRLPRQFRWRRWLPRAALEAVLIVFSVVLALAVTSWAEDRRTAARVGEMREFVIREVRTNRDTLRDPYWLPHHERLAAAVSGAAMIENPSQADARAALDIMFETGVHIGATRDTVWRGLQASGLMAEMKPEEVFLLSDVYQTQAQLDQLNAGMTQSFGDVLEGVETESAIKSGLIRLSMYMSDVIGLERALIRKYDRALAELEPQREAQRKSLAAAATRTDDVAPAKS